MPAGVGPPPQRWPAPPLRPACSTTRGATASHDDPGLFCYPDYTQHVVDGPKAGVTILAQASLMKLHEFFRYILPELL